jgi:predicted amidohydrolase YtcJ
MVVKRILIAFLTAFSVAVCAEPAIVYFNGDILTMEGNTPEYAQAVVVKGEKIIYVGTMPEAIAQAGQNPTMYDLKGHTLLPGFIDTWSHFSLVAQDTLAVNLGYFANNPPRTRADVIRKLKTDAKPFNGWVIGTGYSDATLTDGAITITELDKAFPNQPVLIENISTLTGMVNTAGLKKLGITKATKAVSGFIPRNPKTGELTGDLIGMPYLTSVAKAIGQYSQDLTFDTYRKAEQIYLSNGYTTVQSYEATVDDIQTMRAAVDKGIVSLDLIALPTFDIVDQLLKTDPNYKFGTYSKGDRGVKVAGIMVPTDGAPQLRLGYFSKPFLDTTGFGPGWRGFPYYPQSLIDRYAKFAYEKNIQYFAYSNGDAGIDMTLSAIDKAIKETGVTEDRRTVISHSMFARDDQFEQYKKNNIVAIMLVNHNWLYGDVYKKILGEERANHINALKSAYDKGVKIGIHSDVPSSGPSVVFSLWSAVNRKTLSGALLGPDQRINPYLALQGVTTNAAYQYKEESSKGTITAGKIADLVELDRNPLKVEPDQIKDIQVLQTVKRGKQLYRSAN